MPLRARANKSKKRGVVNSKVSKYKQGDDSKGKNSSHSGWEMFANLSSSSRERKYATNNFTKSKKGGTEDMFNDIGNSKNV